jgi:hypothetical protein
MQKPHPFSDMAEHSSKGEKGLFHSLHLTLPKKNHFNISHVSVSTSSFQTTDDTASFDNRLRMNFRSFCDCTSGDQPFHEWNESDSSSCPQSRKKALRFIACKLCPAATYADVVAYHSQLFTARIAGQSKPKST